MQAKDYHVPEQIITCRPTGLVSQLHPAFPQPVALVLPCLTHLLPQPAQCPATPKPTPGLLLVSSDMVATHVYLMAPFHCVLLPFHSSWSHLKSPQTPWQQSWWCSHCGSVWSPRAAKASPANSCRQRSSQGRFPAHLVSKQAPILFHVLISWLPLHSQPFLLSSSLPKTFRSYWHMFVGRILEFQCKGSSVPFPGRNKTSIMIGLEWVAQCTALQWISHILE